MNDYHLQELLSLADQWTPEQLDTYLHQLENRLRDTRNLIREMTNLKKRRAKARPKETGIRSG